MLYTPEDPVSVEREMLVAVLVAVTFACWTTAPLASVTAPLSVAVCAPAAHTRIKTSDARKMLVRTERKADSICTISYEYKMRSSVKFPEKGIAVTLAFLNVRLPRKTMTMKLIRFCLKQLTFQKQDIRRSFVIIDINNKQSCLDNSDTCVYGSRL